MIADPDDSNNDIISTGCGEIDRKLGGGLPRASLTLIEGRFNAGKSPLSLQIVSGALDEGHTVALYTTEHSIGHLLQQMDELHLDVLHHFLVAKLNICSVTASNADQSQLRPETLLAHMAHLSEEDVIVVDSLTPFLTGLSEEEALSFFTSCLNYRNRGNTVVFTVHSHVFGEHMFTRIRSISDVYLRLDVSKIGNQLVKMLEIALLHDARQTKGNVLSFVVEPGIGIRILPFSRVR